MKQIKRDVLWRWEVKGQGGKDVDLFIHTGCSQDLEVERKTKLTANVMDESPCTPVPLAG